MKTNTGSSSSGKTRVKIGQDWYDLSKWARYHPGGAKILSQFDGHDATDAFFSLHSDKAAKQLSKMTPYDTKEGLTAPGDAKSSKVDAAYREFRAHLTREGWFERNMAWEMAVLIPVFAMAAAGTWLAWSHPLLAIVLLAVAQQQAGWLGHDMVHARNSPYCSIMGEVVSAINGFDRDWWSDKHNTHHVLTNHVEHDPDINNQPFLFLWAPVKAVDHHLRRYQHLYFVPLYTVLYASWRIQSLLWAVNNGNYKRLLHTIIPSYVWLFCLPTGVALASVLLAGFLVAIVVTVSHESEEMLTGREPSFALTQFRGTRDVVCPDPVTEYLFGGMQYQLEHHLFPTLPRYYYPALVPLVRAWAKDNGIEYKADGLLTMYSRHYQTLKRNARIAAVDA